MTRPRAELEEITRVMLEHYGQRVRAAGFEELSHYYRPEGQPREQQPWLASSWRA